VIHALQGTTLAVLISQSDVHHGAGLFVREYTIERGANAVKAAPAMGAA
jgi:hypothetical protein